MKIENLVPLIPFLLIVALSAFFLRFAWDNAYAEKLLAKQGYTQVVGQGYSIFGCSEDDFQHTKFTAISPSGQQISGVVCSGILFKGATIRFDD